MNTTNDVQSILDEALKSSGVNTKGYFTYISNLSADNNRKKAGLIAFVHMLYDTIVKENALDITNVVGRYRWAQEYLSKLKEDDVLELWNDTNKENQATAIDTIQEYLADPTTMGIQLMDDPVYTLYNIPNKTTISDIFASS